MVKKLVELFCFIAVGWASSAPSPRMPDRFKVQFDELIYVYNESSPGGIGHLQGNSTGSWTYDAETTHWIYEHGPDGFFSEFCAANDPMRQRCWLHFDGNDDMKVLYKNGTCCSLCAAKEGCSFLRPDWLTFGNFTPIPQPAIVVGGERCIGWGRPGAVTSVDAWFSTEDGTPCLYFERFQIPSMGTVFHNVTFRRDTYSTAALSEDTWKVPDTCSAVCPKHGYPPKFGGASQKISIVSDLVV